MKIVLVEAGGEPNAPEKSFQTDLVKIGRDVRGCQIVFEQQKYPMVSRHHAQLRCQNGQWMLIDNNSTFGTILNGSKISEPQILQAGSSIQLGENGPMLIVLWFDVLADASVNSAPIPLQNDIPKSMPVAQSFEPANQFNQSQIPPNQPYQPPIGQNQPYQQPVIQNQPMQSPPIQSVQTPVFPPSQSLEKPQLDYVGQGGIPPYLITKDRIWIGRDPNGDIVFEASAIMVSRKHAEISRQDSDYYVTDNNSFNGTLVNGKRISTPTPIYHNDEIQLGQAGPVVRFNLPQRVAPKGASLAGQRVVAAAQNVVLQAPPQDIAAKTMIIKGDVSQQSAKDIQTQQQLLMKLTFGNKQELIIGRDEKNDIKLDGLQISNRHARLVQSGSSVLIEDLNSTNGVYVNGKRVSRQAVSATDAIQIGSFLIKIDALRNISVFDTRSKTRIDCVNITKEVKNRSGGGKIRLLDGVSLSIQPNEFVGLLGPSGAGKSTLMDAMNGMRPASGGSILINNLDLYQHLDSIKQSIGYVPQDDIIHRELTVYRTLYYVAKLRLSGDVSSKEVDQIINEVMDVTGLTERRDVPISQLSGGQRKRVSIAVELITKPSIIYLDEPTSGLDPATEEKIMKLFRQIAESGRTVILTTHAMENVKLFDKIVLLMRGKLVFYGKPDEALAHVGATSFKELYDKIEEPIEAKVKQFGPAKRNEATEQVAEEWKVKFTKTPQYKANVYDPLKQIDKSQSQGVQKKRRLGIFGAIRQWFTLSRRYWEVLSRDKVNLLILFAQAPIVAFLTFIVMDREQPRDFVYFVLALVSVWFGTSVAAREIIRERPVYNRERMVNLGLMPYLASKLFVLGIIVGIQCLMLFIPLKFFHLVGAMSMPGLAGGIPQFFVMLLTAGVGIALGLLISAVVNTSEMATSLVPLILIPQILFSGLVGVPTGFSKVGGLLMPATWSFDTMKRFSDLKTLEDDGTKKGYYSIVKDKNNQLIADSRNKIKDYKEAQEKKMKDFEREMKDDLAAQRKPGDMPKLDAEPTIDEPTSIDKKEMSRYVNFLHPWMNEVLNQLVLMIMFCMMVIATLILLRMQDIG